MRARSSVYDPLWNKLKQSPGEPLIIAAHSSQHRRIYKAVVKRKYEDVVFQYQLSELGKTSTLSHESVGNTLRIVLTITFKVEGLFK